MLWAWIRFEFQCFILSFTLINKKQKTKKETREKGVQSNRVSAVPVSLMKKTLLCLWVLTCFVLQTYLAYLKAKHLLKIRRLADQQQVEGPTPTEVCHDDCIDRHRGEELSPWGFEFLKYNKGMACSQRYTYCCTSMFLWLKLMLLALCLLSCQEKLENHLVLGIIYPLLPLQDQRAWHSLQYSPRCSSAPHQWWSDDQRGSRTTPKSRRCTRKCQRILHITDKWNLLKHSTQSGSPKGPESSNPRQTDQEKMEAYLLTPKQQGKEINAVCLDKSIWLSLYSSNHTLKVWSSSKYSLELPVLECTRSHHEQIIISWSHRRRRTQMTILNTEPGSQPEA